MGGQQSLLDVPAVSVITPAELARDVFQWAHDEEVVDALYLQVGRAVFSGACVGMRQVCCCKSWPPLSRITPDPCHTTLPQ
jgi:hypothetical protein